MSIRHAETSDRIGHPRTEVMQFGGDKPGLFIDHEDCQIFKRTLTEALFSYVDPGSQTYNTLKVLVECLEDASRPGFQLHRRKQRVLPRETQSTSDVVPNEDDLDEMMVQEAERFLSRIIAAGAARVASTLEHKSPVEASHDAEASHDHHHETSQESHESHETSQQEGT